MTEQQAVEMLALLRQLARDLAAIREVHEKSLNSGRPRLAAVLA